MFDQVLNTLLVGTHNLTAKISSYTHSVGTQYTLVATPNSYYNLGLAVVQLSCVTMTSFIKLEF